MGYYVSLIDSTVVVPENNTVLATLKLLDTHDELKTGGSWKGGKCVARWFAWISENWAENCETVRDVLEELGFEVEEWDGDLHVLTYENKIGDEEKFFQVLAQFIPAGRHMVWKGEDGLFWRWDFDGTNMSVRNGRIEWE